MKTAVKIVLCTALVCGAVTMAGFTIAGFRDAGPVQRSLYVLGESEGRVAVYGRENPGTPVTVTDIRVSTLREADRAMLADGLPVSSPEDLARLLEDLGA